MESKKKRSEYYDAFTGIMKITLRDGQVSQEEKTFLKDLASKLNISDDEYEDICQNYMSHTIAAPYTYNVRLENFYKVTEVIYSNKKVSEKNKTLWLERMGVAMGFNPSNIEYIVAKSLDLLKEGATIDSYKKGIRSLNT